jgi:hypothetical protein
MSEGRTNPHQQWEELAAGYALHALDGADELWLLAHVDRCPQCLARLDEFAFVAAQLGSLDDDGVQPPAWAQIRPRAAAEDQAAAAAATSGRLLPFPRRVGARVLAAAAAIVVSVGGVAAGLHLTRHSAAPPASAALTACRQQTGCHVIRMHGDSGDTAAVLVQAGHASLVPVELSAPPAGRIYVLWQLPRDGGPIPVVTFRDATRQTSSIPLVTGYSDTAAFAVSLEAAGPMPVHPTKVVAVGAAST